MFSLWDQRMVGSIITTSKDWKKNNDLGKPSEPHLSTVLSWGIR